MMKRFLALGLAFSVLAGAAQAAPRISTMPGALAETVVAGDLQLAGYHRHGYRKHHHRAHRHHRHRAHRHYKPYHHAPKVHHGYSSAHYNWCAAKYKSYNRHTNTWRAHSGKVYHCRSPY